MGLRETPPRKGSFSFHMEDCSGAFWGLCICEFGGQPETARGYKAGGGSGRSPELAWLLWGSHQCAG